MMKKTSFLVFGIALLLVMGVLVHCGNNIPSKKDVVIGILNPNPGSAGITGGFIEGLAEYGYTDGKNLTLIKHESHKGIDAALRKMIAGDVDLLFTVTTPATRIAQKAATNLNIPIIFVMNNPVESGIIQSLSRPGGDSTGIQVGGSAPKALDWLTTVIPEAGHIIVPIRYDTRAAEQSLAGLKNAAQQIGMKISVVEVENKTDLMSSFKTFPDDVDAVFLLHSIIIATHAADIAEKAIEMGLPTVAAINQCSEGVFLCFSPEHQNTGRQASRLAHQVLEGSDPAETPAEIAQYFLTVNLKAAEKLGITVPHDILVQADHIIR